MKVVLSHGWIDTGSYCLEPFAESVLYHGWYDTASHCHYRSYQYQQRFLAQPFRGRRWQDLKGRKLRLEGLNPKPLKVVMQTLGGGTVVVLVEARNGSPAQGGRDFGVLGFRA